MATKIHLHANLPHDIDKPNIALGYLKSFLSEENVDVTNIYWYLMPRKILESILPIFTNFESKYVHSSYVSLLFAAYISRFFYKIELRKIEHTQPTMVESILSSFASLERVDDIGRTYKDFVDYSIENGNMADVDVAGFTLKMCQWFINRYVWSKLKELNPNITILVGGLDTRDEALAFMKTFKEIDFVIWGEGEVPLREFVRYTNDRKSLTEVHRLVYKDNGKLCTTDAVCEKVKTYPFADHTDYFEQLKRFDLDVSPQIPVFGNRYCHWNRCKFCSLHKTGIYYERPIKEIIEEIEYQSEKYNVNKFVFSDSDIGRKKPEDFEVLLRALLESAFKRKMPYDIAAEVSPIKLNRKFVEMMSKIRISVQIGFEALTDTLLKRMDKMHRFAENIQALKFGNDYGLRLEGLNILRNLPGEREEDVVESMENLKFLRFFLKQYRLRPSELGLFKRARYYKEIPLEERKKRWVINFVYKELNRPGFIKEEDRWHFFGFGAQDLIHHLLWNQFVDLLERFQSNDISYLWLEYPDGSSLIEEYNEASGDKTYLLDEIETNILKFCDNIKTIQQLKNEFPYIQNIEDIISKLKGEYLLYVDERKRLISIPSIKNIKKSME